MRFFLRLSVFVLALCALYIFYWFWISYNAVKSANALSPSVDTHLTYEHLHFDGFPLRFKLATTAPKLSHTQTDAWAVKGADLVLNAKAFAPLSWNIQHNGPLEVQWAEPLGQSQALNIPQFEMTGDIGFTLTGGLQRADINIAPFVIKAVMGDAFPISSLKGAQSHAEIIPEGAEISVAATDVTLQPSALSDIQSALGPKISSFKISGLAKELSQLNGPAIDLWALTGGVFHAEHWDVKWGTAEISGSFELSQTPTGLAGWVTVQSKNPALIISAFADAGLIPQNLARQLTLATTISKPDPNGYTSLTLPIQDNAIKFFGQTLVQF